MGRDFAREIARAALDIGAISLRPEDPFTWASGYRMPIYNDNRQHLRYPENRTLITDALVDIIERNGLNVDVLAGTSTAGIAPAASLAQRLGVPVGIVNGGGVDLYTPARIAEMTGVVGDGDYDLVVSTCPTSIIPAVFIANERGLPFAYVRAKKKGHGLQKQIEGSIEQGERVLLLNFHDGDSYCDLAGAAVKAEGAKVESVFSRMVAPRDQQYALEGRTGLLVEDLVSMGGSSLKERDPWKSAGVQIDNAVSIFSYDLDTAREAYAAAGCVLHPALVYDKLLAEAVAGGDVKEEHQEMLAEWRGDALSWGANHGFPKVEK